jgi:hypothetical protein
MNHSQKLMFCALRDSSSRGVAGHAAIDAFGVPLRDVPKLVRELENTVFVDGELLVNIDGKAFLESGDRTVQVTDNLEHFAEDKRALLVSAMSRIGL